jgi:hypothetical protein
LTGPSGAFLVAVAGEHQLAVRKRLSPQIALLANIGAKVAAYGTDNHRGGCGLAECAYVDERGGVGIRLKPAAAIVRQYGEQFRRPPRRKSTRRSPKPTPLL